MPSSSDHTNNHEKCQQTLVWVHHKCRESVLRVVIVCIVCIVCCCVLCCVCWRPSSPHGCHPGQIAVRMNESMKALLLTVLRVLCGCWVYCHWTCNDWERVESWSANEASRDVESRWWVTFHRYFKALTQFRTLHRVPIMSLKVRKMLSFHLEVEINYLEIDREKLRHFDLNSWSLGFQLQEDRIVTSNIRVFLRPMPTKNKQF